MNALNILDSSKIVKHILREDIIPDFTYKVNGKHRCLPYYLVDDKCPKLAIFLETILEGITQKEQHFISAQEGMRKYVELDFGVLISRWHILRHP